MFKRWVKGFPILQSERIILRELKAKDHNEIFEMLSNKEVADYFERPVANTGYEVLQHLRKARKGFKCGAWIVWGIASIKSNKLIGSISIWNINQKEKRAEISYELLPQYHRMGYMSEAIKLVIKYSFNVMRIRTIEARTRDRNTPSIKLLEKLGFNKANPPITEIDPLGWNNPGSTIYHFYRM